MDTKDSVFVQPTISPWAHDASSLYALFHTTKEGLSSEEATTRLLRFGRNTLSKKKNLRAVKVFVQQFMSPLIFLLVGAMVITSILKEHVETIFILLAILVDTTLGFYQEYKAERTLEKLVAYIKDRSRVFRDGGEKEIDSLDLVPGDIVRVSFGMRVPADARVISVNNFSVDESILTGESLPVHKQIEPVSEASSVVDRTNMLFAGTLVVEGYATALVTHTGGHTEIGRIAELVSNAENESTPLQRSLAGLSWIIFVLVIVCVAGLFILGVSKGQPVLEMLLLSVAVAVGAIPEALPIALTVILTAGVSRIAKHKGIIRNLSAAETLGSTTLVMTDKTGTLTQAKMELVSIVTEKDLCKGRIPAITGSTISHEQKQILTHALISTDVVIENPTDPVDAWRIIGRPLETNIALFAGRAGIAVPDVLGQERMPVLPFNSTNKFSVVYNPKTKQYVVLGAPDVLLARAAISKEDYVRIEEQIHAIAGEGKRILGVARIPEQVVDHAHPHRVAPEHVQDLEFLGALVLYDPVRKEVQHAISRIQKYGAKVVMVTGDLKGTAMAIARELGWDVHDGTVMTGAELREFNDDILRTRINNINIFSRVTPEDKLRIGRLYQSLGEIVAMTGDGVNDAPSLKAVDIGVALGSGSDVAKSASDLVILDDNFETIVLAIEEGRRVIANIRKAFSYLMSNCLDEVILVGGSLIAGLALPLSALQIIWVNFFTGSLTALSFAMEENRDVGRSRKKAERQIFNTEVRIFTIGIGVLTSVLLFVLYWALLSSNVEIGIARTVLFACFASYTLLVAFSFKSMHHPIFSYPLFDNRALNMSIIFASLLVVCSLAVPFLREILGLTVFPAQFLWLVGGWIIFNVVIVEITKWFLRKYITRTVY